MNKRTKNAANFLLFVFLIVFGSWISTQWFAKSMLFSNALDASFVVWGGLKVYPPHQIFLWIPNFWTSQLGVLFGDMVPFFICFAFGVYRLTRTSTNSPSETTKQTATEIRNASVSVSNSYVSQVREKRPTPVSATGESENVDGVEHDSDVLMASIESAFLEEDSGVFHDEYELETAKTYRSDAKFGVESGSFLQPIDILEGDYVEVDELFEEPFEDFKSVRTNFNRIEHLKKEAEEADENPFDGNETIINLFLDNEEEEFLASVYSGDAGFTQVKTVRATQSDVKKMLEVELVDAKTTRLDSGRPLTKEETREVLSSWRPARPEEILESNGRFIKVEDQDVITSAPLNTSSLYSNSNLLGMNTTVKVTGDDVRKMLRNEENALRTEVPEPFSESNHRQTAIILPGWRESESEDVEVSLDRFIEIEQPDFPNSTVTVSKDLQDYLKEASSAELIDE